MSWLARKKKLVMVTVTALTVLLACWAFVTCVRPAFLFDIHTFSHPDQEKFQGKKVQSFGTIKGTKQTSGWLHGEWHFEFSGLCYIQVSTGNQSKYYWGHRLLADGRAYGAELTLQ